MNTRYYNNRLSPETFKANKVPSKFIKYADYLLINWCPDYIDVKRIWPLIWMYIGFFFAIFLCYILYESEQYSYYLFSGGFNDETRIEVIIRRITSRYEAGRLGHFINLFLSPILLFFVLKLTIGRYPTPLRFNKSNGLAYTIRSRRIWVTSWNKAHIKLWRHTNNMSGGRVIERAIAVRLFSINRKGELMTRWEPISAADNMALSIKEWTADITGTPLGGDPSLLYWSWLNAYMQGEDLVKPKVGKQTLFEKLRLRKYYFPKSVDIKAVKLNQRLIEEALYPSPKEDKQQIHKIPNDPYFTHEEDFPDVQRPDFQIPGYEQRQREAQQKSDPMPDWQKRGFESWRGGSSNSDTGNEDKGA